MPCCPGTASPTKSATAQCQGPSRPSHPVSAGPVFGAIGPVAASAGGNPAAAASWCDIYHRGQLIKTHLRQPKGGRSTDTDDYPAERAAYTTAADRIQRTRGDTAGPAVAEFADVLRRPLPWAKSSDTTQAAAWASVTRRSVWTPPASGPGRGSIDVRRLERILVQALEQGHAPTALANAAGPLRDSIRSGSVFAYTAYRRQSA